MNLRQSFFKMAVSLGLVLILAGATQVPQPAWASMEDAAVFYEELAQYGDWVEYENYGPVWYPNQVQDNWRPYVDGRWTPSEQGHVFETQEPWGWATYHYGNWMPTDSYGWVWVPGRTWYPSTVTWRNSPESEAPDASYIGWAPIPPPNYQPQSGYYPPGYSGAGPYGGPVENLITAPFWIFARAASFLLGFGQPYAPNYSYWNSGALIPPTYVPYYYGRTVIINNYYTPTYYPTGYLSAGRGFYNWGPPIPYVARVTRINHVTINNYVKNVNIYNYRNVAPPQAVLQRRAFVRDVVPPAFVQRQPLPQVNRVQNVQLARANLARPNVLNATVVKNAPTFKQLNVTIPKAQVTQMQPGARGRGVPGAALPASAMMQPTKQMEQGIKKIPQTRQITPVAPTARKWQVPQTPGAAAVQPVSEQKPGAPAIVPGAPGAKGPRAPGVVPQTTQPGAPGAPVMGITPTKKPGAPATPQAVAPVQQPGTGRKPLPGTGPQAVTPGTSAAPGVTPAQTGKKRPTPQTMTPAAPGTTQATPGQPPTQLGPKRLTPGVTPGAPGTTAPATTPSQVRQPQQTPWTKPVKPTTTGITPAQPTGQTQQPRRVTPSTPTSRTPTPGVTAGQPRPQVQQAPRPQVQQAPRPQVQQAPRPQVQQAPKPQVQRAPKPPVQQAPKPQPQKQQEKKKTYPGQSYNLTPRGGTRTTGFQPTNKQFQSQSRPQVQQQPRFQSRPQVRQQPQIQPRPQVQQQQRVQPKPQVRQQTRPQPQSQARTQPKPYQQKKYQQPDN